MLRFRKARRGLGRVVGHHYTGRNARPNCDTCDPCHVAQLVEWGRQGDVSYVPKMRTQLVAARTVAQALAELATDASAPGAILEIAGPREEKLVDSARRLVARRGDPVRIEAVSNAGDPDSALYETGGLLPGPNATLAGPTFEEWLEQILERR